jgi:hypothetical protein
MLNLSRHSRPGSAVDSTVSMVLVTVSKLSMSRMADDTPRVLTVTLSRSLMGLRYLLEADGGFGTVADHRHDFGPLDPRHSRPFTLDAPQAFMHDHEATILHFTPKSRQTRSYRVNPSPPARQPPP